MLGKLIIQRPTLVALAIISQSVQNYERLSTVSTFIGPIDLLDCGSVNIR